MRSTVPAVARIVKRMADGLYARQLNLCQVPVSRLTGQVRSGTSPTFPESLLDRIHWGGVQRMTPH